MIYAHMESDTLKRLQYLAIIGICFSINCFADDTSTEKSPPTIVNNKIGQLSGNFAITTDYMFRGVSLSNNLPAVQGGYTYTFNKFGIYATLWGSSTDLTSLVDENDRGTVELDTVVGIANNITEKFSYDISFTRYNYPKAHTLEYNELITKWALAISAITLTAEIDYAHDVYNVKRPGTYYNGKIEFNVPPRYIACIEDVTLSGSIGHYDLPESAGLHSYNDYMLGISKQVSSFTFLLQWIGTNGNLDAGSLDDNRYVGTISVDV